MYGNNESFETQYICYRAKAFWFIYKNSCIVRTQKHRIDIICTARFFFSIKQTSKYFFSIGTFMNLEQRVTIGLIIIRNINDPKEFILIMILYYINSHRIMIFI